MSDPFAVLAGEERALLREAPQPREVAPMKAVLSERRFSDPAWLFEPKLDGVRCLAFRRGRTVRLCSRSGRSIGSSYPELVEALAREREDDFVVDGEVVAFDGGVTSFGRLQQRMQIHDPERARATGVEVFIYLFDVLHLAGRDTTALPLRARKRLLEGALSFEDPLRFTPHREGDGEAYLREACRMGWEGLIAKLADSPYVPRRSRCWLKLKCSRQQELVIGGMTRPRGARTGFGALLLGYYDDGALRYAGKVGTGFDERTLRSLHARLSALRRPSSPFAGARPPARDAAWVEPELVAQVAFSEWTRDGRLRQPRFLGLRDDKPAREVVREVPE